MDYGSYGSYASSGGDTGTMVVGIFVDILLIVASWFLFEKAGEPGWKSIIPGLNVWTLFEIVYGSGWKCLLLLVPGLNIVMLVLLPFRLAKAYGQSLVYGLGMLLLPPVFILLLAFGPWRYRGTCYSFI